MKLFENNLRCKYTFFWGVGEGEAKKSHPNVYTSASVAATQQQKSRRALLMCKSFLLVTYAIGM